MVPVISFPAQASEIYTACNNVTPPIWWPRAGQVEAPLASSVSIKSIPRKQNYNRMPRVMVKIIRLVRAQGSGWIDFNDTDLCLTDVCAAFPGRIVKK